MTGWLAQAVTAGAPAASTGRAIGYPSLFLLVALGSLVPVVPTGALVSGAAVVAFQQTTHGTDPLALLFVFLTAALAAFVGDVALYWLGQRGARSAGGSRGLERLRQRADPDHLETARRRLEQHGTVVLVLSRLVPAGRIPVMVACLLARVPLRSFVRGDVAAVVAWAVAYQAIGILGGSLFARPWEGVALAVGLTLLISVAPYAWRLIRGRARRAAPHREDEGAHGTG
ncbi:DedA family protein [Streptantibioticus parmotrematis]|uniref:DedA family protein n=1 Tax=Streptantibioticus parmotrematis TaxID=2873249 RepID=UPI0027E028E7|nr:VTT domain-containing protein [Streptantibioticus parmotrematis]